MFNKWVQIIEAVNNGERGHRVIPYFRSREEEETLGQEAPLLGGAVYQGGAKCHHEGANAHNLRRKSEKQCFRAMLILCWRASAPF